MCVSACVRRARAVVLILAVALAPSVQANQSSDGIWTDVAADDAVRGSQTPPRAVMPQAYRSLRIDKEVLDQTLRAAPAESAVRITDSTAILQLPMPDGRFESFRIVESPIMAPALAARFPQIRSWLGQGIDDPSATVRLDRSHKGFHAQIISWRGTVLIDPLAPGDREFAMVYHKRDAQLQGERPVCLLTGDEIPQDLPDFSKRGVMPKVTSGATLRTHRLAMAATGEYTQFHGGTVADGLAAINTTMNRVNGIYERDLAVRMVLIPNNDLIIYTDGATDPYTNNSGFAMLAENRTNLDNVIGNANFDIGHVVSTGGGGIASLGSVCSSTNKARGVTGLPSPIGDVFDVDFVAHEIGHQYRGNHAFNGSGGNCSGGNRNAATAYEPGSGITIQSYAGICGADNLQPNSESYFHRVSLDEMLAFVTTGGGSTCGSTSATGNTPPMVSTAAAFTIPQLTPFQLTATGSDADGDTLTYLWEQFDLGAANPAGTLVDNGTRPIFRSFTPTLESTRIFPSLRYILNNANNVPASAPLPGTTSPNRFTGEVLPSTNRTLNFRVTARDNRADGGGTQDALTQITVSTAAGPFRVTSPNTALSWPAASSQTVTWDVAGTDVAPINTSEVVIAFSIDGGLSFPFQTAPLPNTGSAGVTVPNVPGTTRARVRVSAVDSIYFDISDIDFQISGPNSAPTIVVNGAINTAQGSPTATGPVATISDTQDPAGNLSVAIEGNPPDLTVSVANDAGEVSLSATAACTLVAPTTGTRAYPLTLRVTDTNNAVSTAEVLVNVSRNQTPTLGSYADVTLAVGGSIQANPSVTPADANNNLDGASVSPTSLPGGGTVSIDAAGVVTINASGTTPAGVYTIRATVFDTCGAQETRQFSATVLAAPTVASVAPSSGLEAGGTAVSITGSGFVAGASASFGGVACTGVSVNSPTSISCTTPAGTGTVDVTVTNPDSQFGTLVNGWTYTGTAPVITSVSPNSGPVVGGTAVTISGSAFQAGASASFGGAACTGIVVTVPNTISCNTPSGPLGLTNVTVTNPDSQSATLVNGYTYLCVTDPVVANSNDSGVGSLRQAIADACPNSTITFAGGVSDVGLTSAQLVVNKNLTIDGGAGVTVARTAGSPDFRIFSIGFGTTVSISGVTISNGSTTGAGGGIFSAGALSLSDCAITGNSAGTNFGGGISSQGPTLIDRCTISGNQAGNAGGLFHGFNTLTMSNTTVSDNTTTFQGAGVNIQDATATLVNCTISGNRSTSSQAGIAHLVGSRPASSLTLRNCTVTDNVGPAGSFGGVWTAYFTDTPGQTLVTRLENTIVANNLPGNFTTTTGSAYTPVPTPNAFLESTGHNLDSDGTSGFVNSSNGDLVGTVGTPINALLAPLGTFGGPTRTHALLPGSPAINAGTATGAPTTDQRGVARVGAVDIGAFESQGFNLAIAGGDNQTTGPGLAFADPLSVTVAPLAAIEPVDGGLVSFTPPGAGASAGLSPNPVAIAGGSASTSATANGIVGSYTVLADTNGATAGVNFTLTNAAADLSIDDVSIIEGDAGTSDALFTVTRSNNLTAFSVPYSMTPGTAQAGSDYLPTSGVLNFAVGGALTQTITVPVVGDLIVETTETATLDLGAVIDIIGTTTITDGSGLLTITDNDSAVVTFDPVSVSQSEAITPMVFTVTLSNPVQSGVTLDLNSAFGSATAADFTAIVGGTVTFPANSNASQSVNVNIINDALNEDDESFTLTLSGLTAVGDVTLGAAVATGTIIDDDPLPLLSINNPSQPEGNAGTTPMDFVITLTPVSGRDVSFSRATADGTATVADNDYVPLAPAVVTIPAGQTSATVTVLINGDTNFEGDESFSLNITDVINATPSSLSGTGTIEDDDQQPTTTTITSNLPDPSLVGQPYTVNVSVSAQSLSPLGTVMVSDGTDSCGPISLSPGTVPASSGSCELTSSTAGAKLLTASYTPASSAFAASSGTEDHQVDPASTVISVSGPANSRVNQPISFGFVLDVEAPGGGTPSGTVTLSTAGNSCQITLPTATPACDLQFGTLGPALVSASYAPDDGDHLASTSSGPGNAQTLVFALADMQVTKTAVVGTYLDGDLLVYTVTLRNLGEDTAVDLLLSDAVPAGLVDVLWTCDSSGGVSCPQNNGSGDLDEAIPNFPVGGLLNYSYYGNVAGSPPQIVNSASVTLPADGRVQDPNLANNSATVVSLFDQLLVDGFEAPLVTAPSGSYVLATTGLQSQLDEVGRILFVLDDGNGHAARIYARVHAGQIQYALAQRDGSGRLRLGAWQTISGDPQLSWTASERARGWVVEAVDLR